MRAKQFVARGARWLGVDRAVAYGALSTVRLFMSGPVTALLIAVYLTRDVQGFYYTFASLLTLQVFVELGFAQVIVQFTSHEWAKLHLTDERGIDGDARALSRLSSLFRLAARWYLRASAIVWIGLTLGGIVFFSSSKVSGVQWLGPWLVVTLCTAIDFCLLPAWSLLQGANQVRAVNFARLISGLILVPFIWGGVILGAKLWSLALAEVAGLVWDLGYLWRYRRFFAVLLRQHAGPVMRWRKEILPVQWRIAISWICGYFAFQLFIPVIFRLDGPAAAGRFGMTWSLVGAVSAISATWITTKAPHFGVLIARRSYLELDRTFRRVTMSAVGACAALSALAMGGIVVMTALHWRLADRLLGPLPAGALFIATVLMQLSLAESTYLRAHKAEPFVWLSVAQAVLLTATTFGLGSVWGSSGVAFGYLAVTAVVVIPFGTRLFFKLRTEWHQPITGSGTHAVGEGA